MRYLIVAAAFFLASLHVPLTGTTPAINFADAETPSGVMDGQNHVFYFAHAPNPFGSLILTVNGLVNKNGNDFTVSGARVTFKANAYVPTAGQDNVQAWYRY